MKKSEISQAEYLAEQHLGDDQRRDSETRAQNYVQSESEIKAQTFQIDKNESRRPITESEANVLDAQLGETAAIFNRANAHWFLDGAMNISVYNGDYVGVHKDIDVSVDERDLSKLAAELDISGYGVFTPTERDKSDDRVKRIRTEDLMKVKTKLIIPIDEKGKIDPTRDLKYIDLRIYRENSDGTFSYPLRSDVKLPKEWFEPQRVQFHGITVYASNPVLAAYYKNRIGHPRAYDQEDLKLLMQLGKIQPEDLNQIRRVLADEQQISGKQPDWFAERNSRLDKLK